MSTWPPSSGTSRARWFSPGQKGGPLRRGNFNKMSGWPHAVRAIGVEGLHFHDLRHTGNQFAADSGAALKDLMARMGHDSERAALIYQHEARGADRRITDAIDSTSRPSTARATMTTARPGRSCPLANGTLMARKLGYGPPAARRGLRTMDPDLGLCVGAGDGNRTRTISLGS